MYQPPMARSGKAMLPTGGKTRRIRVGIVDYEVPTVEAVVYLERLVAQQAHEIAQQKRLLAQVMSSLEQTQGFVRRQATRRREP
jgi:hypothetical protein